VVSKSNKTKLLDPDIETKKLGARIKLLRKNAGFTNAEDFAHQHSFPRSGYSKIEQGKNIEYVTLIRILNCHGIGYLEFFGEGFE
jgi:transcriptional regulator with XRE-family HTH domain